MTSELRVDFLQEKYPGKSNTEIARILADEYGYIAVIQFEGMGTYLACCHTVEELEEVLGSPYCKAKEVVYHVAPLKDVLLSLQAQGILKYSMPQSPLYTIPAQRSAAQQSAPAVVSPVMDAAIRKYTAKEYMLVSRTNTSAVLKRQAPVNLSIFIILLIGFWIGAIIYLLARKKYQVTLVEQTDGSVAESGGTLEEYESDRAREARSPKSAYVLMIIGALLSVTGGLFGLILLLAHRADPILSQDPAATVTTILLCPTPIVAIGLLMLVGGFLILRRATQPVVASFNSPRSQVSFTEKDNLGTNYDTTSRGESYWSSRMIQGHEYPFVIYYFDNEKNAREALLELPCIHVAQDSLKLICTEVLDFGYYPARDGAYAAFICGNDLTHDLWEQARTSFAKHNGTLRNEQEPEKHSTPVQQETTARPDKVVFVKEMRGQNQVGGGTYIKKRYSAPDAASAKAFLQQHPVTEQFYYIEIETPEGNFGRDIQGIYTY